MDFKKIKKLVSLVETSDISSLSVEEDNLKVEIKRELQSSFAQIPVTNVQQAPIVNATPQPTLSEPIETPTENSHLIEIKSPMVGTFFSAINPESDPFVSNGSSIQKGDIVCIVEAMKLFNEIESEINGTIEKICVNNGDAVEFGQALFLVRPN
jgi:acetyl-CoA carboxylase biotin carboxyl carrier protein